MKRSLAGIASGLVWSVLLTLFGAGVTMAAFLRETPLFWRNAGGYPEELRSLIFYGFYPMWALYFFGLLLGSMAGWRMIAVGHRGGAIFLLACAVNWLLFAALTMFVIWNNVENVLEGRPLHYHGP